MDFPFERFLEISSVEQSRQRIANRLHAQSLAKTEIGEGERNLFGNPDGEGKMRFFDSDRCRLLAEVQDPDRVIQRNHRNTYIRTAVIVHVQAMKREVRR